MQRYITSEDSGVALLEGSLRLSAADKDWASKVVNTFRRLEIDYPSDTGGEGLQVRLSRLREHFCLRVLRSPYVSFRRQGSLSLFLSPAPLFAAALRLLA